MHPASRLIDANLNRAREALRVLEDIARFRLDDRELMGEIKSIRHGLRDALSQLGVDDLELIASRDVAHDVGRDEKADTEGVREGLRDMASAAGKRLTEAMRVIEEASKTIGVAKGKAEGDPPWRRVELLRYRAYEVEMRVVLALGGSRRAKWKVCVIITKDLCKHHGWLDVANMAIDAGADCLQLREKQVTDAELLARARLLVNLCHTSRAYASAIINDRPDIALLSGADGVHLGQEDMSVADVRRVAGGRLLVGVSTTNMLQATRALRDGADYCGVGPMYATPTKPGKEPAGLDYLRKYTEHEPELPPHLAIGGVTPATIDELARTGAKGVAVSSAVCESRNPGDVVRRIRAALDRAQPPKGDDAEGSSI